MSKKKSKRRTSKARYIPIEEAIHTLRISQVQMEEWVALGMVRVFTTAEGRALLESDFKQLANSQISMNAALDAFRHETVRRESDVASGLAEKFRSEIANGIEQQRNVIQELRTIHAKYHDRLHILRRQSGTTAAFILYSRVLALLNMSELCAEHLYWETLLLVRPVNEALDLAICFVISEHSEEGRARIREWFRENKSPAHSVCRTVIEDYFRSLPPHGAQDAFQGLMARLYQATSKPIHSAHHDIMEVYSARFENKELVGVGFDYGPSSYPRKMLGLVAYLESVLVSTVQTFIVCFDIAQSLLEPDDVTRLNSLHLRLLTSSLSKAEFLS